MNRYEKWQTTHRVFELKAGMVVCHECAKKWFLQNGNPRHAAHCIDTWLPRFQTYNIRLIRGYEAGISDDPQECGCNHE